MATLSAGYHQLLESGTALAQTTTTPPQGPPSVRSGSRGIGPAPRTSEPVTRGTSSTPDLHIPTTPKRASVRPALAGPAAGLEGAVAGPEAKDILDRTFEAIRPKVPRMRHR